MIDGIINAKETVVGTTEHSNLYQRILAVMTFNIKTKLATYLLGINASRNNFASLIKQSQDGFIYIIVYKNNALFGTFHEFRNKGISIIDLMIKEDTLLRFVHTLVQASEHLVNLLTCKTLLFLHFQLMILYRF